MSQQLYLSDLPLEIWHAIAEFMNVNDTIRFSMVRGFVTLFDP